ncbi:AraC family transcriptional regulator [Rahnella bruchi]|uniref:AraC family transcriptional regulator n=1 Tax=Rahnella bruchi TaxID=1510573 RepID=UPI000EA1FF1A|nr:AraC family transcriptional regulator [Rahnella bruchi]
MTSMTSMISLSARVLRAFSPLPPEENSCPTALPWLSFIRFTHPTALNKGMLEPSMCLILQGQKKVLIGTDVVEYGAGSYLFSAIDMPVSGQVTQASEDHPYLGIRIDLDLKEMADLMIDMQLDQRLIPKSGSATYVAKSDDFLADAFLRLVTMLDIPQDLQALGQLVKKEIFYRLITAPEGGHFYQHLLSYYQGRGVSEAIQWIKANFAHPLRMDELAKTVGMSVSNLHHRFKALTVMSPLQYQKQIRLLEARRLLLSGNIDAATAAFRVGYESPSQFNREYRRSFGAPPLQDIGQLRLQGVTL